MTTDMIMLVAMAIFSVVWPTVYLIGRTQSPGGMQWALGNRDTPLETPAWAGRAVRAHLNLIENLAPFAILVLVAQLAGKANATTALAATVFFWARVAHAFVYTMGIVGLRTALFFVGVAAELVILMQLF